MVHVHSCLSWHALSDQWFLRPLGGYRFVSWIVLVDLFDLLIWICYLGIRGFHRLPLKNSGGEGDSDGHKNDAKHKGGEG